MTTFVPPAVQPGDRPALYTFGARNFERLCSDLLREEKGIATSSLWGVSGQAQQGIDIQADAEDGVHLEVGQCKCYREFGPKEIRTACSEFIRHWEHWKSQNVRRFILFVACEVENTQSRKAILEQKKWFSARGMRFEVWDAPQIIARLNPHPGIVRQYFANPEYWVPVICGIPGGTAPWTVSQPQHDYASQFLNDQVNELAAALSSTAAREVEGAREAWREGRRDDAFRQIREIRQDAARWRAVAPAVKAKVLRLEANFEFIVRSDSAAAVQLANEADALDSSGGGRLRVLLAYAEGGPDSGLQALDRLGVDDPEFRVALLLEGGQVEACLAGIEEVEREKPLTAELHRLRVLALLARGEVAKARAAAAVALEQRPRWEAIRLAAAMADYISALSPAALPGHVPAWPAPLDWTRIRRDDETVARLRAAEAVFREVAEQPGHPRGELTNLQGWRIACLASDPERQEEATDLCRSLLATDPGHVPALVWTLARRFEIPVEPSLAVLSEQLDGPRCGLQEIMAIVNVALFLGLPERAAEALDRMHARFTDEGEEGAWIAWRLRSALASGDSERADALLDRIDREPGLEGLKPLRARVQAERSGDPVALLATLAAEHATNSDPGVLLESCLTAAELEQWGFVAEHAEGLVERVGTAEAVRLAVIAHFNTGAYDRALTLLDGHLDLFRQRRLPPDLRRVRVRAQEALGVLPAAVAEAEALVQEEPSAANLLELARVYASKGDLRGVVWVTRRLKEHPDLSPANALRLAATLQMEDLPLARDLWRRAAKGKLSPALVEHAVGIGFRLGVDAEMGSLMRRFYALAEKGGRFRVLRSVDEALPLLQDARDSAARGEELYRGGQVPIHMLAGRGRIALADLYHAVLDTNEQDPSPVRQTPLRTRHGGRPTPALQDHVQWRLHADVTAILLSHHLGVLTAVERAFGPVRIAPELIPSLLEMRTRLIHPQASQVDSARALDRAARQALFAAAPDNALPALAEESWHEAAGTDWVRLWHRATVEDALVCDDLPLYHRDDLGRAVELPEAARARVAEPAAIANALLDLGAITQAAHETATARLSPPDPLGGTAHPIAGQRIYCARGAAGTLAQMGVLEAACRMFQVTVHPGELQEAEALTTAAGVREEEDRWLSELVERLSDGIDAGRYEVIPVVPSAPSTGEEGDEGDNGENLLMASLRTLLRFEARSGDVVWFDDRFMTGYQHRDGYPIVDTVEVLAALVGAGAISRVEYFQHLHRLRAANVRLIPLSAEELSHQLRRARFEGEHLVETSELRVLRRYVAATLLDGHTLQRALAPDGTPAERHELTYVLAMNNALDDVLIEIWGDETMPVAQRRARSEWLVESLFLDLGSARGVIGLHEPFEDDRYQLALSLAGFVVRGLVMQGTLSPAPGPAVHEYLDWVTTSLLQPRIEADPLLLPTLAHTLAQHILDVVRTLPAEVRPLRVLTLQRLFDRLPPLLQDELAKDAEFMGEAHIAVKGTTQIAGFTFPARAYLRAAAKATNGASARVPLLDTKGSVRLLPSRDPENWRAIQLARGRERWNVVFEGPVFGLLRNSVTERTDALRALRRYFVGSEGEFEEEVARVATLSDPYQRVKEVEAWRTTSPAYHYERLTSRISGAHQVSSTELRPPDLDAFVRAHGLSADVDSGEALRHALAAATRGWIETEGIRAAFLRVCGIPTALPETIVEAFVSATPGERRRIVRDLLRDTGSPIARVQLMRLMASAPMEFRLLMRWVVRCLLSKRGEVDFRAFGAMLNHTDAEFTDPAAGSWAPMLRLAMVWSHAYQLFEALHQAEATLEAAPEWFDQVMRRDLTRLFVRQAAYRTDAVHPKHLGYPSFLVTSLGYALHDVPDLARRIVPQTVLMELIAPGEGSHNHVDFGVFRDPSLGNDALGSFLANDRGVALQTLTVDAAAADELRVDGRRRFAEEALDLVEAGDGREGWARLYAVAGESPLYPELRERLERILLGTDFVRLHASTPQEVRVPLLVASVQAAGWGSPELWSHVEEALVGIAGALLSAGGDDDVKDAAAMLMDIMLRLAWRQGDPAAAAAEFARIARRVLDRNTRLAKPWRIPAERLWTEVPASCARPLAELLVRVRAE